MPDCSSAACRLQAAIPGTRTAWPAGSAAAAARVYGSAALSAPGAESEGFGSEQLRGELCRRRPAGPPHPNSSALQRSPAKRGLICREGYGCCLPPTRPGAAPGSTARSGSSAFAAIPFPGKRCRRGGSSAKTTRIWEKTNNSPSTAHVQRPSFLGAHSARLGAPRDAARTRPVTGTARCHPQWGRGGGTALPRGAHTLCSEHWGGGAEVGIPSPSTLRHEGKGTRPLNAATAFSFLFFL